MDYLLLLLSALSLVASQDLDEGGKLCPVHVVVNQIVLVRKTPVYVSAHICEESALVVGGTTIHVPNAPTFLETRFEIANTITATSTMTLPGDSNGQPIIPGGASMGNAPVKPGIIPGGAPADSAPVDPGIVSSPPTGNAPIEHGSTSTPPPNSDNPTPSDPSAGSIPSSEASASSDTSSIVNLPSTSEVPSEVPSGGTSTSIPKGATVSTTGPSGLDSTTGPLTTETESPTGSSFRGTTTIPSSTDISTTGPSSTASDTGMTPTPSNIPSTTAPPSSSTSICIVTATPVPECCVNELPAGCEALESTNGPALEPIIPACESALEPYLTQDMKDCWAGDITEDSQGTYIADCLEYELELTCITELPSACKALGGATGSAVPAGAAECRKALGPFVHNTSAPCLDEANITDATQGQSIVDCLEVAFGFRSGPVTITDGEICPRTTSAR